MNGTDLLAELRTTRAEAAFGELVRRYTNLVDSIAKRRVGDMTLAQEVSQIVFIRLAKAMPRLASEAKLLAWLHRTTVHVSIDLWRSDTRRRAREQLAVAMQDDRTEDAAWNEMVPVLDEALDELDEADRHIVLLRFFEQKTMADLARALGISEDAAKMRVSRAVKRLRVRLGGLGATCSATLLGALLFERSVQAAPEGLAPALAAIRLAAPVGLTAGLAGGLASLLSHATASKLIPGVAAAIVLGAVAVVLFHSRMRKPVLGAAAGTQESQQSNAATNDTVVASSPETNVGVEPAEPRPLDLLRGAVRARQRIATGIMEFQVFTFGNVTRLDATNALRLKIQFEDGRLWAESIGQEYRYVTPVPGGPEADAIVKRADALPREQAVLAGLLQPFPSRHVMFYDSQAVTDYWETDSSHPGTAIRKPGETGAFIFDPRCLGITLSVYVEQRVEQCLNFQEARSITLLGKESVDENACWHVRVLTSHDDTINCWFDVAHPIRVLKIEAYGNVALSRYSDANVKDPLPTEVRSITYRDGAPRFESRFVRVSAHYDIPIDPANWTLDGLHMKYGTTVSDYRNHRGIGYWTGSGLSDDLPRGGQAEAPSPSRVELLSLLDYEPASPAGFSAALWIMTNSPDGADLQKAAEVVLQSHIQNPELVPLVRGLERMRPSCSSNLLQAMVDQNPVASVRGNACLALAVLRQDACEYGKNKSAAADAEKRYERVVAEFGQVIGERGYTLAELVRPRLSELHRLTIGKVAPAIEGIDLDGNPMKLSDYRGKIVALFFWSLSTCESDAPQFNWLMDDLKEKPFVLLGIHTDENPERAKSLVEKYGIKWPSFDDKRFGPIYEAYNIAQSGWPTIYVLDRNGLIRYRGLHHRAEIAAAVEALLKE